MASCKDECEALMSSVLPRAEQLLTEHRVLQPFGSTLSVTEQIAEVGDVGSPAGVDRTQRIREFQDSFRDGARRGELKATLLIYSEPRLRPGASQPQDAVAIYLDHRDDYSLVVTFPYHFTAEGELVIEEPFATEGEHAIFAP